MTDTTGSTTNATVTVSDNDTLPEVLGRIRDANGQTVRLEISEHCPIFLTATEFRTLRDTADRAGVTIELATDDPLRLQLASMFGLADFARPVHADDDGHTDREVESTPSFHGWRAARARHAARTPEPEVEDPISVSRKRRSELYAPGTTPDRASTEVNVGLSQDASLVSLSYLEEEPGAARAQLIGRIVAVVAVLALILGIVGWYFMPAVTVHATLRQGQIGTELLYSVTRPGANAPADAAFAVEGQEVSDTVDFDITIPATGVQVTPDKAASGTVTLRNASPEAVTVPAGTTLTIATGAAFTTNDDVEVPAGSADGSTIGEAEASVTSVEGGATGNLEAGALSGKIADLPIYFSNRGGALSGGTDIEVAVVSDDDIANLESQVSSDLRRVVAEDWTTQLPGGQAILTPSVETGTPDYTIEQQAGDVSDTVTLRGTVEATALQYDDAEVRTQAQSHYEEALAGQVPEGYELVPGSVALADPALVSESPDSVEFTMSASATVRARFEPGEEGGLSSDLADAGADGAPSILDNVPAFETWEIERSPGWWPDRMPRSADRITITIDDQNALPPPATGTPPATPGAAGEAG
jgi:hypothetical protein